MQPHLNKTFDPQAVASKSRMITGRRSFMRFRGWERIANKHLLKLVVARLSSTKSKQNILKL